MRANRLPRLRDALFPSGLSRWAVRCLPYDAASRLLSWPASLTYLGDRQGRERTFLNLRHALGNEHSSRRLRRIARRTYRQFLLSSVELHLLMHSSEARLCRFLARRVRIENLEVLTGSHRQGRGVLLCSPHFGSFLLGGAALAMSLKGKIPLYIFADRPTRAQHPSRAFAVLADRFNIHLLYNDPLAILPATRALRRGGILIMLPDMFQISDGLMFVPLFGLLSAMMGGTAFLALRTGAPTLFAYNVPQGRRYRMFFDAPLAWESTGDREADLYHMSRLMSRHMERRIRQQPELWGYWINLHRRIFLPVPVPDPLTWADGERLLERLGDRIPSGSADTRTLTRLLVAGMSRVSGAAVSSEPFVQSLDSFSESLKSLCPFRGRPSTAPPTS